MQNIFRKYCSPSCSRSDNTSEAESELSDYDWLYDQRITQRKSKDTIAAELGVSITPVNRWLLKHGIKNVRYNESELKIQSALNDKQLLEQLYSQENTFADIANLIGSSVATVQRFFKKHGIEPKAANSYDRDKTVSAEEQSLVDWVRSVYTGEVQQGNRKLLNGRELDIVLPDINIAIEYNGFYSHIYRPNESHPS